MIDADVKLAFIQLANWHAGEIEAVPNGVIRRIQLDQLGADRVEQPARDFVARCSTGLRSVGVRVNRSSGSVALEWRPRIWVRKVAEPIWVSGSTGHAERVIRKVARHHVCRRYKSYERLS